MAVDVVKACYYLELARTQKVYCWPVSSRANAYYGCKFARLTLSEGADPLAVLEAWAAGLAEAVERLGVAQEYRWAGANGVVYEVRRAFDITASEWVCQNMRDHTYLALDGQWLVSVQAVYPCRRGHWSSQDPLFATLRGQGLWPPEGDSGE